MYVYMGSILSTYRVEHILLITNHYHSLSYTDITKKSQISLIFEEYETKFEMRRNLD